MQTKGDLDVDHFLRVISGIDQSNFHSDVSRRKAVVGVQALLARLQTPREKTTQILNTNSYLAAAVKSLMNLNLFKFWEQAGGKPKTVEEVGEMTGAEPAVLERLLRILVTSGLLSIDGENRYEFSDFAKGLASGGLHHAWELHPLTTAHNVIALPKYLQDHEYHNPTDSKDCPWAYHMGAPIVEHLHANPQIFTHLNGNMKVKNIHGIPWFTFYPMERLLENYDGEGVLLVDVGGGTGYGIATLEQFLNLPLAPGRLVLQDLSQAIGEVSDLPAAVEKQSYDFFTEQPVKGAKAYYLHNVLHDWSVEECLKILARVKDAMKPGYSRLLINEIVLSPSSTPAACAMDLNMMAINGGAERSTEHWNKLLSDAGFRITQTYMSPAVDEGVIEAEI